MRIGVFCANEYTTPPPNDVIYAPLEISQTIADGLVERGHDVTVYAPKGSRMKSKIKTLNLPPLFKNKKIAGLLAEKPELAVASYQNIALSALMRDAQKGAYDIIHIHPYVRGIFFAPLVSVPVAVTVHDVLRGGREFIIQQATAPNLHFISISNAQRKPVPNIAWKKTIYHGINMVAYPFTPTSEKHLVYSGRIIDMKGTYEAVLAAKKARVPLHIAGGPASGPYWERKIKPHLSKTITYVGMVPHKKIASVYAHARGCLFPTKVAESFGLSMAESMACGTPVVGFPNGSIPEVIIHKKTGFVVRDVASMARAIHKLDTISRRACRTHVEKHFSYKKMIDEYENLFIKLISHSHGKKK